MSVRNFAVVFVHPFWLLKNVDESSRDYFCLKEAREEKEYGSYEAYCANIQRLHDLVGKTDVCSVFALSFERRNEFFVQEEGARVMRPLRNSLVFDWSYVKDSRDFCIGESFEKLVQDGDGFRSEESFLGIEGIAYSLKSRGIESLAVCGEMGPCSYNVQGCVGALVLSAAKQGMYVFGIKDCVYPLNPQEQDHLNFLETDKGKKFVSEKEQVQIKADLRKVTQAVYERTSSIDDLCRNI